MATCRCTMLRIAMNGKSINFSCLFSPNTTVLQPFKRSGSPKRKSLISRRSAKADDFLVRARAPQRRWLSPQRRFENLMIFAPTDRVSVEAGSPHLNRVCQS
ncbi:hypothetical protein RND71_017665 [Anisodus tanguticus]|uniref:Uncharacterized protein n=1 Tax=Anisodus tanguticus TaxID=243964 RepID=A0AAE1VIJ2_9SOLA|nr:hypothetical protein RND71_017665 [Anisodus tanguticus]